MYIYIYIYMHIYFFSLSIAPIYDTIPDFWRMIWECNVNTVVMLCGIFEGGKVNGKYLYSIIYFFRVFSLF